MAMSEKAELLRRDAEVYHGLDGDIAVMHQHLLRLEQGDRRSAEKLRNELRKLKLRICWDGFAEEFSAKRALEQYGPRP